MIELLAQTSMPALPIDLETPGVKYVVMICAIISAILSSFVLIIAPLVVRALKAAGVIKRTYRDEFSANLQSVAQAVTPLIEANKLDPTTPGVDPSIEEKVKDIAGN